MKDKPYSPRLGGRYQRDKDSGERVRVEGTEQPAGQAHSQPIEAKAEKPAAKPRKEA